MFGENHRDLELPQQVNECRDLETVVADLDHMAQRVSVESLGQQFEKTAEILVVEFLVGRELPEQGAEPLAELSDARIEKTLDRVARLAEHPPVDGVARTFHGENEGLRNLGGPFAERRRRLRAVERAVDLNRGQVLAGVGQLARLREALRIENPAPGLVGPAANTRVNMALPRCHSDVMS